METAPFITEYILCPRCLEAAKKALLWSTKVLGNQGLGRHLVHRLPFISGCLTGEKSNTPRSQMQVDILPDLSMEICHSLRIALFQQDRAVFFLLFPGGTVEELTLCPDKPEIEMELFYG